ncbi:MAG: hypothetical protein LQ342_007522 [Letrouitia transgressa]|nr:MAG: hypothetical protein LQ342_007522 [Letrouitia transgressa]
MDAKEVNEKAKALTKATANREPSANIINLLNELKIGVAPTEDLLRSTKIGVVVNRSKQSKDPEVARLASEIVKKWRDEVQKHKGGTSTPNGMSTTANGNNSKRMPATPEPSATAAIASTTASEPPKSNVPPDQRDYKKDNISITRTSNATRDNCIGLLYNGLAHTSTVSPQTVISIASTIESAAFTVHGPESAPAYKSKIRSLFQNLKNKMNPSLRVRVLSGEITPERFVVMTHEELRSAEQKAQDREYEKENEKNAEIGQLKRSISSSLECGKCKQRKVSYSQAQTRSADEPMTTFCECTVCGNRWKISSAATVLEVCGHDARYQD